MHPLIYRSAPKLKHRIISERQWRNEREFQLISFGFRTPMTGNFTILQKNIVCFNALKPILD